MEFVIRAYLEIIHKTIHSIEMESLEMEGDNLEEAQDSIIALRFHANTAKSILKMVEEAV